MLVPRLGAPAGVHIVLSKVVWGRGKTEFLCEQENQASVACKKAHCTAATLHTFKTVCNVTVHSQKCVEMTVTQCTLFY